MKAKYILKKETIYGISAVNKKGGEQKPIYIMGKSKQEISDFIKLCNSEGLEPVHLKDAIADILYD